MKSKKEEPHGSSFLSKLFYFCCACDHVHCFLHCDVMFQHFLVKEGCELVQLACCNLLPIVRFQR